MNWFQRSSRSYTNYYSTSSFAGFLIMMGIFGHVESRLSSSMNILIGWRIPYYKEYWRSSNSTTLLLGVCGVW